MNDKTRENGRTREEWGPYERSARRTTNKSDRSDIRGAWRRAYVCVKHMKTQNPEIWGGLGVGGTSLLCLFVDIKRERSGDYTRV